MATRGPARKRTSEALLPAPDVESSVRNRDKLNAPDQELLSFGMKN
jgi:hypothetical protein